YGNGGLLEENVLVISRCAGEIELAAVASYVEADSKSQ
nr:hypothetical protein [Tanacetum cinerariifolium]